MAASSCGSCPATSSCGAFSTSMSGSTPWFSTTHWPLRASHIPKSGIVMTPPSTNGRLWLMPTRPPQVRMPIAGPMPRVRK